jgi:hypothetical protein
MGMGELDLFLPGIFSPPLANATVDLLIGDGLLIGFGAGGPVWVAALFDLLEDLGADFVGGLYAEGSQQRLGLLQLPVSRFVLDIPVKPFR